MRGGSACETLLVLLAKLVLLCCDANEVLSESGAPDESGIGLILLDHRFKSVNLQEGRKVDAMKNITKFK